MRPGGVSYVILGALSTRPRSGYEIKSLVDRSTRFFWAASYGQIYPALRCLEEANLVEVVESGGGRRRVRYGLTATGRKALLDWLKTPNSSLELRDEALLKLFFADALEPRDAIILVRSFREQRQARLDRLYEVEAQSPVLDPDFTDVVLAYGIELHEWVVAWCSRLERQLDRRVNRGELAT
jgi:DNA-binding PadR family transcriptional regulator